jgi:hypothetical protein
VHPWPAWHNDILPTRTSNLFAFRGLQTSFSGQRVPGFWPVPVPATRQAAWRNYQGSQGPPVIPISKDGSKLSPPMGFHYYATVSAADLDAIVAYLRTAPPKE